MAISITSDLVDISSADTTTTGGTFTDAPWRDVPFLPVRPRRPRKKRQEELLFLGH